MYVKFFWACGVKYTIYQKTESPLELIKKTVFQRKITQWNTVHVSEFKGQLNEQSKAY